MSVIVNNTYYSLLINNNKTVLLNKN